MIDFSVRIGLTLGGFKNVKRELCFGPVLLLAGILMTSLRLASGMEITGTMWFLPCTKHLVDCLGYCPLTTKRR